MKSCCSIFKKELFQDIKDISSFSLKTQWLSGLIPSFDSKTSGVWLPIIIKENQSKIEFTNILSIQRDADYFNPCNCVGANSLLSEDFQEKSLDCSYCNDSNYSISWNLIDNASDTKAVGMTTSCCEGACDVRMFRDDYLTKLPVLNNRYLTEFYDWKYLRQFPACSNLGLGHDQFGASNSLVSLSGNHDLNLMIDWKIKERISEIPPNGIDTYHNTIEDHEQSYARSLGNSRTCGNFLLTKLNPSSSNNPTYPIFSNLIGEIGNNIDYRTIMPAPEIFTDPYGFKNTDYYNIFVNKEKLGSYWKWNYSSGVLCWYRYYDIKRPKEKDNRLIPGVDLYISDGDVFFASNDGPEPAPVARDQSPPAIKACPSGLKLIKNSSVTGIIPNESNFIYISSNIYNKTYAIMDKLYELESDLDIEEDSRLSPLAKLELSALLATGPNYHEVTVDLLKTVAGQDQTFQKDYPRDQYKQIILFNKAMLTKEQHSLNRLNIVKTKEDLINTLVHKYGCYIWCPPNTTTSISLNQKILPHCYIDLDFEPSVKLKDTKFFRECSDTSDCYDAVVLRNFTYDQDISVGNLNFSTNTEKKYRNRTCNNGIFTTTDAAHAVNAYFNGALIKQTTYGNGCSSFYQKYLRPPSYDLALAEYGEELCSVHRLCNKKLAFKYNNEKNWFSTINELKEGSFDDASVVLSRAYPANAININASRIGFHKEGGLYYDTNIFGQNNVVFTKDIGGEHGNCKFDFKTKNVGIKIYNINIFKLRSSSDPQCKTFPLDQACKCFPLVSVTGYQYECGGNTFYSNSSAILFTPNLSTQFGPDIKSYGGYSENELNDIVGSKRLPNHPSPGSSLPKVNKIIDPLNPYECEKSKSINLPNYIITTWKLSLNKYSTNHSDVWVKLIDSTNLFSSTLTKIDSDGEIEQIPNPSYRRFTTKGTINNTVVFHNQEKVLFEKDGGVSNLLDIEFINPFLYALLDKGAGYGFEKHPYSLLPCSREQPVNSINQDIINVFLIFKQLPRKQVLNFNMEPIKAIGTLTKTFFHPNSGMMPKLKTQGTSLTHRPQDDYVDFSYEKTLFESEPSPINGSMFSAPISNDVKKILLWINQLNTNKKIRLYIYYNSRWYEYLNPHILGYFNHQNDSIYPGYPLFFEYTSKDKTQIFDSALIPATPKYNTPLFYVQNIAPTGYIEGLAAGMYPLAYLSYSKFVDHKQSKNKIAIAGSRAYFMLPEKDQEYKTDHNFSDLLLNFEDYNTNGYIKNSERFVSSSFNNNNTITLLNNARNIIKNYKILKKSLYNSDSIFTVLELEICESCDIDPPEGVAQIYTKSFVVLQNFPDSVIMEKSELLSNKLYSTKWGDLINLDPKIVNDLTNSPLLYDKLHRTFPSPTPYPNILHKISINDLNDSSFIYHIVNTGIDAVVSSGTHVYQSLPYYHIHQKYNIGLGNDINQDNLINYQNFIPIIDINLVEENTPNKFLQKNTIESGIIYISGVRSFTHSNDLTIKPSASSTFFVSLNNKILLKPVLFNKSFYSDTLRIDHPYYRLSSLSTKSQKFTEGCSTIIEPNIRFGNTNFTSYFNLDEFQTSKITTTFATLPIYCDSDIPNKTECLNSVCAIKTVGTLELKATYSHHPYEYVEADDLPSSLQYSLSVDEGLYSNILPGVLPHIQRFEIPPNSTLFNDNTDSCFPNKDYRPSTNPTYIDSEYQTKLQEYVLADDDKGDLVKNTDILANEMLFRLLYGHKQEISQETIKKQTVSEFIKNKNKKSVSHLVQYSSPRTTADKIYDLIPYDYSLSADSSRRKISGNIIIQGVLTEGAVNTVSIGHNVITIIIQNIDNKICAVASCNGKSYTSVIKDTRNERKDMTYVSKGNKIFPTEKNQTIEYITTCQNSDIGRKSWGMSHYYSGMSFEAINSRNERKKISIDGDYAACKDFVKNGTPFDPPGSDPRRGAGPLYKINGNDWEFIRGPLFSHYVISLYSCGFAYGACSAVCGVCDSRGGLDGELSFPKGCTMVASNSAQINLGGYARGLLPNGSCPSWAGKCMSLSPALAAGDFDALIGGTTLTQYGFVVNCKPKANPCSTCMTLDAKDNWGKIYDPKKGDSYAPICECQHHNYGYCTISNRPCDCNQYAGGFPKIFSYNFEYCGTSSNYKFNNIKGHIYKYRDGDPVVGDGVSQNVPCLQENTLLPACYYIDNGYGIQIGDPVCNCSTSCDCDNGTAGETCYWTECVEPAPPDWDIYWIKTTNPSPYEPKCPEQLCYISYDNNKITIDLIGSGENHGCFDITLRNQCPEISIKLHNDTFTFSDSINSECSMCDVEKNETKMIPNPQQPEWDIITETRTAVLGYLGIEGDRNVDVTSVGSVWASIVGTDSPTCGTRNGDLCCHDGCYIGPGASIQCAKSSDASRPWSYALTCRLNGSAGAIFNSCIGDGNGATSVTNVGGFPGFAQGSDNSTVKSRHIAYWKQLMEMLYTNTSACHLKTLLEESETNIKPISEDDLIEGVVPNSCSKLNYTIINYPMQAVQQTTGGGSMVGGSFGVHVAYFTYKYKRPKTIQDIFLKDNASKCATATSHPATSSYNITEKYETKDCADVPSCTDRSVDSCDKNQACCIQHRSKSSISAKSTGSSRPKK